MTSILERAKEHYAGKPRGEIKVPEWGAPGKPAVVTWTALTVRDRERIYGPDANGRPVIGATVILRAVIYKACDENHKPLFDEMDEHDLRYSVDADVVGRVANAILYGAGLINEKGEAVPVQDQVEAAKNG